MNLVYRSVKRLLRTHSISLPLLADSPLPALLHRFLLEEERAHQNIFDTRTRKFSGFDAKQVHETALKDQQQGILSTGACSAVPLSQHTKTGFSEERECQEKRLEYGTSGLSVGATVLNSVTHVDDSACMLVDDSVYKCILATQKRYEKRSNIVAGVAKTESQTNHNEAHSCEEGISELMVADAGTILHEKKKGKQFDSITSDLEQTHFVSEQKKGNQHFDCGASEVAIFDPCKASCKDTNKETHVDSSIWVHALETVQMTESPSKDKKAEIVNDSASEFLMCNSKSSYQKHNAELVRKEGLQLSVNYNETGLQRLVIGKPRVEDASEVCVKDAKTSSNKNTAEGTCSDSYGFPRSISALEKVESLTKEPHRSVDFAMSMIQKIKKKKKKKRKKKKNTSKQFGPEDLKHLSITPHPFHIAASGQSPFQEMLNTHGESSKDAIAPQESSEYVPSKHSRSTEAHNLKGKEVRECVDAIFEERRQPNQGINNRFVGENQDFFICENSSKSRLQKDQKLFECQGTEHRTKQVRRLGEKGPSSRWEDAHRPICFVEKDQAALLHDEVIEKGSSSQTHLMGKWQSVDSTMNMDKKMDYNQIMDGTSIDPPSNYWEQVMKVTPVETIANWDHGGLRKVHYPIENCSNLFIILDLNGVLIKRWDKHPSLPGVSKVNKKWIQLRPGCIEFLQKAFSSFRVGIWSTMTQKNVRSVCTFLEQKADQSFPFFMLWSKDSCYQHMGVRRPNKGNVAADFKPLSRVWGYFKPFLGFHNTVLVDDSPYKACMNNPYNCIFPDAFEGDTDDEYLNNVLWPYLEKMKMSHNMQAYIASNPLGQPPVVVGHELYRHVRQVMDVFDYRASPLRVA